MRVPFMINPGGRKSGVTAPLRMDILYIHTATSEHLNGTVARDFSVSVFFMDLHTLYGPQISSLKGFYFLFRFREAIRIF
jgi:hypothetical protein